MKKGITAILGAGFDPGVSRLLRPGCQRYFDKIDTIDILDVNAGSHAVFFRPTLTRKSISNSKSLDLDRTGSGQEYPTHS